MKKTHAFWVVVCGAALLLALSGCSFVGQKESGRREKSYAETMNEKLVSFTDCANAFSDSLDKIADRPYAPSPNQTAELRVRLDSLKKACAELAGQKAPEEYAQAQSALDKAAADYAEAFDKCGSLLDFYAKYDELFRKYPSPAEGSEAIGKTERALYSDFAQAMEKATLSFRAACEEFDKVSG